MASLWEIAIKNGLSRPDFSIDLKNLRLSLHGHGYQELPVTAAHTLALAGLPPIHRDPFDRMLVAQAMTEGFELITADRTVALYGPPVRLV